MTIEMLIAKIQEIQTLPTFDDWSRGYCESIMEQLNRGRRLTDKQMQALTNIFARNSPEEVEKHAQWQTTYKQVWAEKAVVLCCYYEKQGVPYFSNVRSDVAGDRVPARHSFMKMVTNKYAAKVLAEWSKEPRYTVGTSVIVRDTVSRTGGDGRLQKGGVVLTSNEVIISAASGSKRYKVLPYGSAEPILVEERYIKLYRKPRKKSA
tara:strand:- start:890 stop:1510 length:621 start_codon:yes stop_codon:yes gene_type:complete